MSDPKPFSGCIEHHDRPICPPSLIWCRECLEAAVLRMEKKYGPWVSRAMKTLALLVLLVPAVADAALDCTSDPVGYNSVMVKTPTPGANLRTDDLYTVQVLYTSWARMTTTAFGISGNMSTVGKYKCLPGEFSANTFQPGNFNGPYTELLTCSWITGSLPGNAQINASLQDVCRENGYLPEPVTYSIAP